MKIAIVGAGAIGGLLGARLSLAGEDVAFIARHRNLLAIEQHGIRLVESDGRELHAPRVRAYAEGSEAGPQDAVLLAVKAHQVQEAMPALQGLLGPATAVVSMSNGLPWWYFQRLPGRFRDQVLESVDPGGAIGAAIEPERVIGSVVYAAAEVVEPGKVRAIEGKRFVLGEPDGRQSGRIEALAEVLERAGFEAPISKDIRGEIWLKLWGNLCFNPVSALSHATLEGICRDPDGRALVEAMMKEARAVAKKLGVVLRMPIDKRIAGAEAVGAHKTSMLQDVEAGRSLETEALIGSILEMARLTNTPAPAIESVYALVKLLNKVMLLEGGGVKVEKIGKAA